jgi:hypothetical protein
MELVKSDAIEFSFIEQDFRKIDFTSIGTFNVYLFDGPHDEVDQYDGIVRAQPSLDRDSIIIVDDWNWQDVRIGTCRAIKDCDLAIQASIEIRTTLDNSHPACYGKDSDWHNGYFIAAVHKMGN